MEIVPCPEQSNPGSSSLLTGSGRLSTFWGNSCALFPEGKHFLQPRTCPGLRAAAQQLGQSWAGAGQGLSACPQPVPSLPSCANSKMPDQQLSGEIC